MKKYNINYAVRLQRLAAAVAGDVNIALIVETKRGYYSFDGDQSIVYISNNYKESPPARLPFDTCFKYLMRRVLAGVVTNIYITC